MRRERRRSSAGANPARQLSLQPVAIGADDEGNDSLARWVNRNSYARGSESSDVLAFGARRRTTVTSVAPSHERLPAAEVGGGGWRWRWRRTVGPVPARWRQVHGKSLTYSLLYAGRPPLPHSSPYLRFRSRGARFRSTTVTVRQAVVDSCGGSGSIGYTWPRGVGWRTGGVPAAAAVGDDAGSSDERGASLVDRLNRILRTRRFDACSCRGCWWFRGGVVDSRDPRPFLDLDVTEMAAGPLDTVPHAASEPTRRRKWWRSRWCRSGCRRWDWFGGAVGIDETTPEASAARRSIERQDTAGRRGAVRCPTGSLTG